MITTVFASGNAGFVQSQSSSYQSALNGVQRTTFTNASNNIGQYRNPSGEYFVRQYFSEYDYVAPPGLPVFAIWKIWNDVTWGTSVSRDILIREFNYGSNVTNSDFRTPGELYSQPHIATVYNTHRTPSGRFTTAGARSLFRDFGSSVTLQTVMHSTRNQSESAPSSHEQNQIRSVPFEGTAYDPQIMIGHATIHKLNPTLIASCQLSTGDWIVAERDDMSRGFLFVIKRIDPQGNEHLILEVPYDSIEGTDDMTGAQTISMCRDNEDNFYILDGGITGNSSRFRIRPFEKRSDNSWERIPIHNIPLPYDNPNSEFVSTSINFHDVAGGRLVAMGYRQWGEWLEPEINQNPYVLLDSRVILRRTSGQPALESGGMGRKNMTSFAPMWGYPNPINPYGSVVDTYTSPDNPHRGYIVSAERHAQPGSVASVSVGKYHVHSGGSYILESMTFAWNDENGGHALYDPDARLRCIGLNSNIMVKIVADERPGWGLTLDTFRINEDTPTFTKLGTSKMDLEEIPSFPDGSTLSNSLAWNAVHFPVDNNIWIYYLDDADDTRLMRTSFSMDDRLATRREVLVDDTVTAPGETIHAIRVQRDQVQDDYVLVTLSIEDASGNHRLEYIVDRINVPPTQPVLNPTENFDSSEDYEFSWIFSDPNFSDEQSAYQVQFVNSQTMDLEYDTGKITSGDEFFVLPGGTIPNNEDYIWRVRVWDIGDYASAWSNYHDFSVSNTGIVSITFPSVDNEELFIKDIPLTWSLVNAGQEEYRVVVTRVDDGELFLDTGWVESSVQEHLVEDILSDVQYLFQVTTRQSLVESNTAQRLVFSHYVTPETPLLSIDEFTRKPYLSITIDNPEPRGDRPEVTINEVWRRKLGDTGVFEYIGSAPINSTFRDYTVASGEVYEYKVRGAVEA